MRATTLPLLYHNYHFPDRLLNSPAPIVDPIAFPYYGR